MNVICAVFAARRYWSDEEELQRAYETLKSTLPFQADRCALVTEEREMEELTADAGDDLFVAIPISGAIQQMLLTAAARCPSVYLSFSVSGFTEILLSASRFSTSSSLISRRISLRTSFSSFLFSFIGASPLCK